MLQCSNILPIVLNNLPSDSSSKLVFFFRVPVCGGSLVLNLRLRIKSDRVGALSLLSSTAAFCGVVSDRELLPELAPSADRVSSLVAMMTLHVGRTTPPVRNAIMMSFPQ